MSKQSARREYMRAWKAAHPGYDTEKGREWRAANPDRTRELDRRKRGIPEPTRLRPELCEWPGCRRPPECVDHCHESGAFRGWLCNPHNLGLGQIGDTLADMRAGVDYLTRAESEAWLAIPGHGLPSKGVS